MRGRQRFTLVLLEVLATMTPLAPGDEFPDVDETLAPLDEDPFRTVATSARP